MITYDNLELKLCIGPCDHKGLCFLKFSLILYNSDREIRDKVVYFIIRNCYFQNHRPSVRPFVVIPSRFNTKCITGTDEEYFPGGGAGGGSEPLTS